MEITSIVLLSISGLLLVTAGTARMINPIKNYSKNSGIKIKNEVNILSEARGIGSVLMLGGIIILLGTIIPMLTITSHIVAVLLFFGYATGRLLSIRIDGKPNKLLITGLTSELILGSANVVCLSYSFI